MINTRNIMRFLIFMQCALVASPSNAKSSQSVTPFIQFSSVSNQLIETSFASFLESSGDIVGASVAPIPSLTDIPPHSMTQEVGEHEEDVLLVKSSHRSENFLEKIRICEYLGWEASTALHALVTTQGNVTAALVLLDQTQVKRTAIPNRNSTITTATVVATPQSETTAAAVAPAVEAVDTNSMKAVILDKADSNTRMSKIVVSSSPSSEATNNNTNTAGGIYDLNVLRDLQSLVLDASCPVLLQLHASWCGPCRQLTPLLESLVSSLNTPSPNSELVRLVKVDVDEAAMRGLVGGSVLDVRKLPALLLVHRGRVLKRLEGFPSPADMTSLVSMLTTATAGSSGSGSGSGSLSTLSRKLARFAGLHALTFSQREKIKTQVQQALTVAQVGGKAVAVMSRDDRLQVALALACIKNVTHDIHSDEARVVSATNTQQLPLFAESSPRLAPGTCIGLTLLAAAGFVPCAADAATGAREGGGVVGCVQLSHHNLAILDIVKQTVSEVVVKAKFASGGPSVTLLPPKQRVKPFPAMGRHITVKLKAKATQPTLTMKGNDEEEGVSRSMHNAKTSKLRRMPSLKKKQKQKKKNKKEKEKVSTQPAVTMMIAGGLAAPPTPSPPLSNRRQALKERQIPSH